MNQEFIDAIHEKYSILLQPIDTTLACRIFVVQEKEETGFRRKSILVKKIKSLDYAPYGAVIVLRSMKEVEDFDSYWKKAYSNYLNKHKPGSVFV